MSIQRRIGIQKLSREMDDEELSGADWEGGYDGMIGLAREASARITALEAENGKLREALTDIYKMDKIDAALDPEWAIRVSAATLSQIDKPPGTD